MKKRIIALFFMVCLLTSIFSVKVSAAEEITYSISASTTNPSVGEEFEVVISLTNYGELTSAIRGLQIDVKNIDSSIFEVVSHSTSISDTTAASNKTSYSSTENYIRLVYLHLSSTLDKSTTEVMRFSLKVRDDVATRGAISLPITIKIGTTSENITLSDTLEISYSGSSTETQSISVSWGDLNFTYSDGSWNPTSHQYEGVGWTANEDSNYFVVTNNGASEVSVDISYNSDRTDIAGSFKNGETSIDGPASIGAGQAMTFYLFLTGKPTDTLDETVIGTVTIRIGGE